MHSSSNQRIFLIGFMGAGKTTLGKALAQQLSCPFKDTDDLIIQKTGLSIPEIFKAHGQQYFRLLESKVLREALFFNPVVVASGGGLPCFWNNLEWMNANGVTIFLDVPLEILAHRLSNDPNRPLLKRGDWKQLFKYREGIYQQAKITVACTGEVEHDLEMIRQKLMKSYL